MSDFLVKLFAVFFEKLIKIELLQPWDLARKMRLDTRVSIAGRICLYDFKKYVLWQFYFGNRILVPMSDIVF